MAEVSDILIELCKLPGPSSYEEPVTARICELLKPYVDESWVDVMGNVIAVRRCGTQGAKKLLFDAHIDEIGFVITGSQDGFLRFERLGGLDARTLPASTVEILTQPPIYGVIAVMPPHVLKREDMEKVVKIEDLFIDAGLTKEEAEAIPLGTPGVMRGDLRLFGENLICGKAIDDRAGFAAILKALELLSDTKLDVDLYIMASSQEEVGVRGATSGVFGIAPDWSVVIDVGHGKTPDAKPLEAPEILDGGIVINLGPNMNKDFTDSIIKLAVENEIKHQIEVSAGGSSGTNARAIQVSREGVATSLLSIPLKYMHTQVEVASINDIEAAAKLMCETAKSLKGGA
ncbi:MAG: M20/M25/M40 family metallo-hydrolase [Oscillospiraceae bacterium]|nr:M20/M25/M40 family metallo-hydrolase [Oscillospiraceae bacterium]